MNKNLIFGLGTGRCGTYSLTKLFQHQDDTTSLHEAYHMPWEPCKASLTRALVKMCLYEMSYVVDVGFYWINYVKDVVDFIPNPRFVCLKRNREEVIESFDGRTVMTNYWTSPMSKHWDWDKHELHPTMQLFPKYDAPKKEAIGLYWDEYYRMAEYYSRNWPDLFGVFDIESLNTEDGVSKILSFAGYPEHKQTAVVGEKINQTGKILLNVDKIPGYSEATCPECGENAATHIVENKTYGWHAFTCADCKKKVVSKLSDFAKSF